MPPKADISLLFHPKKGKKQEKPAPSTSPRKPVPRPKPAVEDGEEDLKLPDGPYQEFKLMSSALNGWKYDVMKFDSRKPIDISRWAQPIKLNRKELRRDDGVADAVPEAVAPMLGPDGKPVIGIDGKMVMVDSEGKPIHPTSGNNNKGKSLNVNGKKRFQKKTRQVFFVPEGVRQLRREERYPWVMEDSSLAPHTELWIGQMEEVSKSETHAFFMPAANDVFKFVPAHRWYKFQKKLKHDLPTDTADVESLYTRSQKRDPQVWLANRNGKGPSAATAAMFKAEAEGRSVAGGSSLVYASGQSLGPGGRKLKAVDSGADLFDEDSESRGRSGRDMGEDGDMDEQPYEEDFADDEEQMEVDDKDEEAKEIEERIKREYKAANKQHDTGVDAPSDDEATPAKSKQTKAMQKLIRQIEGNEAYDSDEEDNPYASSEEEEEEEEPVVNSQEPAVQQQPQQVSSRASSQAPPTNSTSRPNLPNPNTQPTSPSGSPVIGGGHSVVAKRATSPKPPKPLVGNVSRSNSPLGSRPTSPVAGSRATSPGAHPVSRAGSPVDQKPATKRKATDDLANGVASPHGNGMAPKQKKRKGQVPGSTPGVALPPEQLRALLIDWLATTPNASTRDCIHHFTHYLTDQEKKTEFSKLVREVAQLKDGVLVLRKKFQEGGSNAPSPAPTSAG